MNVQTIENKTLEYDVVIMGGSFAGLCQARHLMLNIPNIQIAIIDPRPENRTDKDLKIGESTVEIAATFLAKDLGLFNYLVDNQLPKYGLNFHWPKKPNQTNNHDDYYNIWTSHQPAIPSFQLNRAKFEQDLLKMNQEMGATFYNGRVVDFELTAGDETKTVEVKLGDNKVSLKTKHVIDAAGRNFLIGKKTDNLVFDSENLQGVNNGSAWMRIKNVDRFLFDDDYHPNRNIVSHYYGTNHYFGNGHWLWMIPIDNQEKELSIGIIHHHDVISAKSINTKEKFLGFLQTNHTILYNLIVNSEQVDFHYRPKLAHKSKTMFSANNWYVIGDAASIFDAFYSLGTSMIAFAIESVTEIIRAKLAGEADAEEKRAVYNEYNLTFANTANTFVSNHPHQLGHASIMSWRIYFDYMWWFGVLVPMYIGKWHLDIGFLNEFLSPFRTCINELIPEVYEQFEQLVEKNANIGLMDCYRADQLLWGYNTLKHFDEFLENTKLEPQRSNVYRGMKHTFFYMAIWYIMLQWKGFGIQSLFRPRRIYYFFYLLALSFISAIGELRHQFKLGNLPDNTEVQQMREEFKSYQYQPLVLPRS